MEERYLVTDIMYLCTFDFINSVIKYADTDKVSILLSSSYWSYESSKNMFETLGDLNDSDERNRMLKTPSKNPN